VHLSEEREGQATLLQNFKCHLEPATNYLKGLKQIDVSTKSNIQARHWWLTPVILATQEAEIRRIVVQSQPGQIVHEILSCKYPALKMAGEVAQVVEHLSSKTKAPVAYVYNPSSLEAEMEIGRIMV
jgi:hypothetical protein